MKDAEHITQTAALLAVKASKAGLLQGSHVAARDALELHRLATRLHRFDERNCCEDLGCPVCHGDGYIMANGNGRRECRQCAGKGHTLGRREARAEARAREIAERYGFRVYFQGDCRGCPVYLIPEDSIPDTPEDFAGSSFAYPQDAQNPPTLATLQARWLSSYYSSAGVAVCHLGR